MHFHNVLFLFYAIVWLIKQSHRILGIIFVTLQIIINKYAENYDSVLFKNSIMSNMYGCPYTILKTQEKNYIREIY